jgi:selenocysteine lyase/cysteine desulfurase
MIDCFAPYREGIIGIDKCISTQYKNDILLIYTDWIASGRLYAPIEDRLRKEVYPMVANTHTETNATGRATTLAYHKARSIIKEHVNASPEDILISSMSGMTGVVNKFQRILGLKIHENFRDQLRLDQRDRPVIFVSHMEHHSNQTSWQETIGDVVVVPPNENGLVCLENYREALALYKNRPYKIAAITSCSNVTGIFTPYMDIAQLMHAEGGLCFVDFACSAPYIDIDMHEDDNAGRYLDAIYFSPHKFLGGPGASGILIFNKNLYHLTIPDAPGGGTVNWTNPWGEHEYISDIETREDGGTPSFLQTMKTAMCVQLKNEMGTDNIRQRDDEILNIIWDRMGDIPNINILAPENKKRLPIISFYIDGLHYNLAVRILNDRFGIQTRGGCSCAGTYGHYLLNVDWDLSHSIFDQVHQGFCGVKPGWIRASFHPTQTDQEVNFVCDSIIELSRKFPEWIKDYVFDEQTGEIFAKDHDFNEDLESEVENIFNRSFSKTNNITGIISHISQG